MPPLSAMLLDRPLLDQALASAVARPRLLPPAPVSPELEALLARPSRQRSKLWEFGHNLHCSITGTCLTTAELRQVFVKLGRREVLGASEHDVHASAVLLAGKRQDGAKLLHKALDRRHRAAIGQFDKAKTVTEVRALWGEASDGGNIPGAYWAALSHPACNEGLIGEIFAEVHMLSHLVGAANRADIRQLRQLEEEKAQHEARLARKEEQLSHARAARDRALRERAACAEATPVISPAAPVENRLVIELKSRLARGAARRERVEGELAETRAELAAERKARRQADLVANRLREELEAIEAGFGCGLEDDTMPPLELTLLYVGGKQARIGHLRALADRVGAVLLYHDGGIEERGGLLPGLVSRADAVLFPVNCVSHAAMLRVKRLCRQAGKKCVPLRGAGLAPFCATPKDPTLLVPEG